MFGLTLKDMQGRKVGAGEVINIYKYSNDVGAGTLTNLTYIWPELTANILMMNKNIATLNS